ncbi:acetone carboxylase subunit gamma [Paraconexibacter sp.]|uniref:acetone carboxylase subunit gamma n=1 Tax=Paraconexibacter sp. TaxID=2949640 RepID=UPI0035650BE5
MSRHVVTEYLAIDLEDETWRCRRCDHEIGDARKNYKRGLLIAARDPAEVHPPGFEGDSTLAPDAKWCQIVECYCPGCGAQVEVEYLPPGHPLTHDIQIDIDALKASVAATEEA